MSIIKGLLAELDVETHTTRRILERVPQAHLAWRPHPKSMSLGQLALHIATIPGSVAEIGMQSTVEPPEFSRPAATDTRARAGARSQRRARPPVDRKRRRRGDGRNVAADERGPGADGDAEGGFPSRHHAESLRITIAASLVCTCGSSMCPCRRCTDQLRTRTRLRSRRRRR